MDMQRTKQALDTFNNRLTDIEANSKDALALLIFLNGCTDIGRFAYFRYAALAHYPSARAAARPLEELLSNDCEVAMEEFMAATRAAKASMQDSLKLPQDLFLPS